MRKTDLHPTLQRAAIPVPDKGGVYAVVPPPVPNEVPVAGNAGLFARARAESDRLAETLASLPNAPLLMRMLNRREAVDSSQIEGTHTAFDELLYYEMTDDAEADGDASQTLNYVTAFLAGEEAVRQHGVHALTTNLLCTLHEKLMSGSAQYTPGLVRTVQNWIGSTRIETARFVPPPPDMVPELLADLQGVLQFEPDSPRTPSALMRAAIAHAQFEAIHPFRDGNGRVGRLLIPLMFLAEEAPPLHLATFMKLRQQEYYDALLHVQMKLDWEPWIRFFLECVISSCMQTRKVVGELARLQAEWRTLLANKRRHATVHGVVELLIGYPVLTVNEVMSRLDVTFPAANSAIKELVELDILRTPSRKKRNRVFQSHQVLNAMYTGLDSVLQDTLRLSEAGF